MSIKSFAKRWLPPILLQALRHFGGGIRFEGNFATWEEAAAKCTGYDSAPILAKVLESTLKVKRGEAAYERDSVLFDEIEYVWPVTAGLMWAAAQSSGRLDVLDFGGALGSSYFQNREFLTRLQKIRWAVVEQAHYVDAGKLKIQSDVLRFYSSIEQCTSVSIPNTILLSSVLEYLPDPYEHLNVLLKIGADIIIIDRTPFTNMNDDCLKMQRVKSNIFDATIPCRLMSRSNLLKHMNLFGYSDQCCFPSIGGCSSEYEYSGYIFVRK